MQNSELYRRGVVVPLDEKAEQSLRVNDVDESANVRYLSVDDRMFEMLREVGLFQEINSRCDSLLDDYEEEWIEATRVTEILVAIDSIADKAAQQPMIVAFLEEIRLLVKEAATLSRPVLFVF